MKKYKTSFTVEWAHCDLAGIVYYPHFYTLFDQATERMFKAMGFPYATLEKEYRLFGAPLLETGATYKNACKLGDELSMESWIDEVANKTFLVRHVLHHLDGRLALEGFERRVMAAFDTSTEKGMKAVAIPAKIRAQFAAD